MAHMDGEASNEHNVLEPSIANFRVSGLGFWLLSLLSALVLIITTLVVIMIRLYLPFGL